MSVRNYNNNHRSTRVEDYSSDEDENGPPSSQHHNTPTIQSSLSSSSSSPRQQQSQQQQREQSPKYKMRNNFSRLRNSFSGQGAAPPMIRHQSPLMRYYGEGDAPSLDDDEVSNEEDLHRYMYAFGLEDIPYNNRNMRPPLLPPQQDSRRASFDYFDPARTADPNLFSPSLQQHMHSPGGYFLLPPLPPRYEDEMDFAGPPLPFSPYFVPSHLQDDRFSGPPLPPTLPPPPPHWLQGRYPMMEEDLVPYVRRSTSSRSYNRRNRPNQRVLSRRIQELFLSHDNNSEDNLESEDEEEQDYLVQHQHDVNYNAAAAAAEEEEEELYQFQQKQQAMNRPSLSRQSSVGSNSSRKSNHIPVRKRRANSLSAAVVPQPTPMMWMDGPRSHYHRSSPPQFHQPPRQNYYYNRRIHSEPNSPQYVFSDENSEEGTDNEYFDSRQQPQQPTPMMKRRNSTGQQQQRQSGNNNRRPPAIGHPLGKSLSFQGIPPHHHQQAGPPPPPPQTLQQQQGLPSQMILHPPPMPHPMMDNNPLRRNASMFNLPSGANVGGDFFVDSTMMNNNTQQISPSIQTNNSGSQNGPTLADLGGGSTTPNSNGDNTHHSQQQGLPEWITAAVAATAGGGGGLPPPLGLQQQVTMMAGPPPQHMGLNMFNNPMLMGQLPPQQPMWNFMNPQDMFFGGGQPDFPPLPFMNSNDPNLIAAAFGGMVGGGGPPLSHLSTGGQHQLQPHSSPSGGQDRSAGEQHHHHPGQGVGEEEMIMHPPPQQQQQSEPMLRRGLSLLGGLFAGGSGNSSSNGNNKKASGPPPHTLPGGLPPPPPPFFFGNGPPPPPNGEDFNQFGNFSTPVQGGNSMFPKPQTKKDVKKAQQYAKLGTIWCWRMLDSEDHHFESFSIPNQKIIKRKSEKSMEARGRIMLGREKKLPGEILVDLNQFKGCCMMTVGGKNQFYKLEIKQEPFDGTSSAFVFANQVNGNGGASFM